jgi:hypothetical protein
VSSDTRVTVPSSIALPCRRTTACKYLPDRELERVAGDDAIDQLHRVAAAHQVLNSGETSISADALRIALYSCSWCASYELTA